MKQTVIPLTGGLDVVTDPMTVDPGSSQFMVNYEIGNQRGPRRIDGFSKYDGRRNLASTTLVISAYADTVDGNPTGWTLGQSVLFSYFNIGTSEELTVPAVVIGVSDGPADDPPGTYNHGVTVMLIETPAQFQESWLSASSTSLTGYAFGGLLISSLVGAAASAEAIYAYYAALIEQLPGTGETRIPGLHFFNDKLYAVVDCVALDTEFSSGGGYEEGASLFTVAQAASIGKIVRVRGSSTAGRTVFELVDYDSAALVNGVGLYWSVTSGNLIPDGTFDVPVATTTVGTYWTTTAGWAISGGTANGTATGTNLTSVLLAELGYAYEVTYTLSGVAGGDIRVIFGGASGTLRNANGTYTETLVATTAGALIFDGVGAFTGAVDNVIVRKTAASVITNGTFTGSAFGWTLGAWAYGSNAVSAAAVTGDLVSSLAASVVGRAYRVTYTLSGVSAGTLTPRIGNTSGVARAANGTYTEIIQATNTDGFLFTGAGFTGTLDNVEVLALGGRSVFREYVTPKHAAMYYADWDGAGGWTRLDLGREMSYDEGLGITDGPPPGDAFFLPFLPSAFIDQLDAALNKETAWIGADSWDSVQGNSGTRDWGGGVTPPENIADIDTLPVSSDGGPVATTVLRGFFSAGRLGIPAGATITGIQVRIQKWATNLGVDTIVQVALSDTRLGDNKPMAGFYAATPGTLVTYPATTEVDDLWHLNPTPSELNSGDFNVRFAAHQYGGGGAENVSVDAIQVKIHYREQARKAYIYDATKTPTDQEIEVISHTVARGTATGAPTGGTNEGHRRGILTLDPSVTETDVNKPWPITIGLPIYTLPGGSGGGGSLLAFTASDDEVTLLASSYQLDAEPLPTRYTFASARPYARDDADVFFICSGVTNAYMFEGSYALPIQTGLLEQFERPRHACWAGNYLALGYGTGTLQISDLGDPLVYISNSSLAAEIGASDRVVGLLKLKGDSLGVFTENTIFALQGAVAADFQRIDISPATGALEYSVIDVGQPIFMSNRGFATLQTTDQYGDFNRGQLSWSITPLLIDRLQSNTRNQTVDRTFSFAYAMRHLGQYRAVYNDGWQHTLTFSPDGRPLFSSQHIYGDWENRDETSIRILGMTTGVTSTGQDVAFMSFAADPTGSRYRYAFQVGVGRSFDGEPIFAQWMSQPLTLNPAFEKKDLSQIGVYAKAFGYAALKMFTAPDLGIPVSDELLGASPRGYPIIFGTAASSTEGNYKFIKTFRAEAEDITLLFESISATELPHTLQALVLRFDPSESRR